MWDVEVEDVAKAFALIVAMRVPEGVPPTQPQGAADVERGPELDANQLAREGTARPRLCRLQRCFSVVH